MKVSESQKAAAMAAHDEILRAEALAAHHEIRARLIAARNGRDAVVCAVGFASGAAFVFLTVLVLLTAGC